VASPKPNLHNPAPAQACKPLTLKRHKALEVAQQPLLLLRIGQQQLQDRCDGHLWHSQHIVMVFAWWQTAKGTATARAGQEACNKQGQEPKVGCVVHDPGHIQAGRIRFCAYACGAWSSEQTHAMQC